VRSDNPYLLATIYATWYKRPYDLFYLGYGFKPTSYQKKFLLDLTDLTINRMMICSGSGLGKTRTLGIVALWSAGVLPKKLGFPYHVVIGSGSNLQSQKVNQYVREALSRIPILKREVVRETKTYLEFRDGSFIIALPCSDKSLFGQHGHLFIVDEAVEADIDVLKHMHRIVAPCKPNRIILSSTPHEYASKFVEMWLDEKKYSEWRRYSWSPLDINWLSREELDKLLEEARKDMGEEMFRAIMLGQPVPVTGTLFPLTDLAECLVDPEEITMSEGMVTMGVDWGFTISKTGIVVAQFQGDKVVILHTELVANPRMEDLLAHIEELYKDFKVARIYCDLAQKGENQRLMERGYPVTEVHFSTERPMMRHRLKVLIEQHRLIIAREKHTALYRQLMKYTERTRKDDDLVDALMLAIHPLVEGIERQKFFWFTI